MTSVSLRDLKSAMKSDWGLGRLVSNLATSMGLRVAMFGRELRWVGGEGIVREFEMTAAFLESLEKHLRTRRGPKLTTSEQRRLLDGYHLSMAANFAKASIFEKNLKPTAMLKRVVEKIQGHMNSQVIESKALLEYLEKGNWGVATLIVKLCGGLISFEDYAWQVELGQGYVEVPANLLKALFVAEVLGRVESVTPASLQSKIESKANNLVCSWTHVSHGFEFAQGLLLREEVLPLAVNVE